MADYETPYDRMNRKNREAERIREIEAADRAAINKVKPGAPYYQPQDEAPDRALTRAKAQGEHVRRNSTSGDYQQDEGLFADTVRTVKNMMAGKRGRDAIAYGDEGLMAGARAAGREAVQREADAEMKREARGMKKGGTVSASKRADGIAQRGKTKGRMC